MKFENPIIQTKHSLLTQYKELMKANTDVYVMDLGESIPIYSHYINKNINIEHYSAKAFLNKHLTNITNAYKQFDTRIIERMLIEEANKIKLMAKGSVLTDKYLKYSIDTALINNDTIEVEYNSSVRFLTNPYYEFKGSEYDNQRSINYSIRNKAIGDARTKSTHQHIYNCISDYDCTDGRITKKKLANSSELSLRTINKYLKAYPILNSFFNDVKELSATDKQKAKQRYNNNSKVA